MSRTSEISRTERLDPVGTLSNRLGRAFPTVDRDLNLGQVNGEYRITYATATRFGPCGISHNQIMPWFMDQRGFRMPSKITILNGENWLLRRQDDPEQVLFEFSELLGYALRRLDVVSADFPEPGLPSGQEEAAFLGLLSGHRPYRQGIFEEPHPRELTRYLQNTGLPGIEAFFDLVSAPAYIPGVPNFERVGFNITQEAWAQSLKNSLNPIDYKK